MLSSISLSLSHSFTLFCAAWIFRQIFYFITYSLMEKRSQNKDFITKNVIAFGKYAQTLRTYLLINSSFALKHLLCVWECCRTHFTLAHPVSFSLPLFRTHSSSVSSLFFIICRGEYRKRQIGSFTFMIPFHCVHLCKLCLFSWFYAGTNRGEE